jgi:hypothetical protein
VGLLDRSDRHPPRTDDERFLAARYGAFVRALERNDADGICRPLAPRLAESYKCGARSGLRIPPELRGIEVPLTEVFSTLLACRRGSWCSSGAGAFAGSLRALALTRKRKRS